MRPYRSTPYQQYSRQRQQEDEHHNQLNYSQTWDENNLASGWGWQQSNSEWPNDYAYVPYHRQYPSEGYVADISSGYGDSSLGGWTAHNGHQQWDTTYGAWGHHYRDNLASHSFYNSHYDGTNQSAVEFRPSGDRHYPEARNHHNGRSFSRTRDYGQQRRPYHSSATTSNPSAAPTPDLNNAAVGETPVEDFSSLLFRQRDNQKSTHRAASSNVYMERQQGPSEDYMRISAEKSETLGGGTRAGVDVEGLVRKLLVLDLNGTLVYRSPHRSWRDRRPGRGGGVTVTTEADVYAQFDPSQPRPLRTAHARPYLTSFRNYLFHPSTKRWLDTMVWSSAQPHSVGDMVEKCFGDKKGELVAIWARDRLGLAAGDYGRKVQTTKDLNKPWTELNSNPLIAEDSSSSSECSKSTLQRNHSARTTLLLDDSPLKAHLQPYNHLCLKEYGLEMRKHDMSVRELEAAREKLGGVLSEKQTVEEALDKNETGNDNESGTEPQQEDLAPSVDADNTSDIVSGAGDSNARKRKRKEKKETKKKERIEQQVQKLKGQSMLAYDETLLAVIGILDATKRETNVAAWIRSGGLIQSLMKWHHDEGASVELKKAVESPKKKLKVSKKGEEGKQSSENEDNVYSVGTDQGPPPSSSPPCETSPLGEDDRGAESETERTGVPVNEPSTGKGAEETKDAQNQLWFNHPGTEAFWASRGRKVLEELEIDVVPGVLGPTG